MPVFNIQLAAQNTPNGQPVPPNLALMQRGPIMPAMVCLAQSYAKPLLAQGKSILSQGGIAMIDTGAITSAIDEDAAKSLGLPVIDQGKMTSASHDDHPCNFYPAQITLGGQLTLQVQRALGARLKKQGLIALIGRDVLMNCTFIYNGGMGSITLAL